MRTHPTLDTLQSLRLNGMSQALMEQRNMPDISDLSCAARLGLLVDRARTERDDRRRKTRLHKAKLRQAACIEDVAYRPPRGLDKAVRMRLATCQWGREHDNLWMTGPTGIGKTWVACALGQQACRDG
jgi:DNA replication protein DnaC